MVLALIQGSSEPPLLSSSPDLDFFFFLTSIDSKTITQDMNESLHKIQNNIENNEVAIY